MTLVELLFKARTEALDKASKSLDEVAKSAKNADSNAASVGKVFSAIQGPAKAFALVASATAGTLAALAYASIQAADRFDKLSQKTNIAVDRLSLIDNIAKMADSSVTELSEAADRLAVKLVRQGDETGRAGKALETLGVSAKDANGEMKSTLQIQEDIVVAASEAADAATAEAAAISLLGTDYYKLRGAVLAVKNEKSAMYDVMLNTGQIVTENLSRESATFNDNLSKMGGFLVGVGNSVAQAALPTLNSWLETANGWIASLVSKLRELMGLAPSSVYVDKGLQDLEKRRMAAQATLNKISGTEYANTAQGARAIENAKAELDIVSELTRELNRAAAATKTLEAAKKAAATNGAAGEGNRVVAVPKGGGAGKTKATKSEGGMSFDSWYETFQTEEKEKAAEATKKAADANAVLLRSMLDLGDPTASLIRQQLQIEQLMRDFPQHAEGLASGWFMVQEKIEAVGRSTQDATPKIDMLSRIGETAFKGLEDSLMSLANSGTFSFKGMISSMLADLARLVLQMTVIQPLLAGFKAFMGGGSFTSGFSSAMPSLLKSANGNVFDGPTLHGYSGGIGMLGEAGPEAIMPLKRGADGKLGIAGSGGGGVVQNISVQVSVEGGKDSEDTGNIVSEKIVQVMRGIIKQEIGMDKKRMAYAV